MREVTFILALAAFVSVRSSCQGQIISTESIRRNVVNLDSNQTLSSKVKLQLLYDWKRKAEASQLPQDSVYALLLRKIGVYEFYVTRSYTIAIEMTLVKCRLR